MGGKPIRIESSHVDTGDKLPRDVMLLVSRLSNMRFPLCDPGHYLYHRLFTGAIQLNFAC